MVRIFVPLFGWRRRTQRYPLIAAAAPTLGHFAETFYFPRGSIKKDAKDPFNMVRLP
jgi:hypothetical protein